MLMLAAATCGGLAQTPLEWSQRALWAFSQHMEKPVVLDELPSEPRDLSFMLTASPRDRRPA